MKNLAGVYTVLSEIRTGDEQFSSTIENWLHGVEKTIHDIYPDQSPGQGNDNDDAGISSPDVVVKGINDILLYLYGKREKYYREKDKIDAFARESIDEIIGEYSKQTIIFIRQQFERIRKEFQERYGLFTGLSEDVKKVGSGLDGMVSSFKGFMLKEKQEEVPKNNTYLIEELMDKYLGKKAIIAFNDELTRRINARQIERWEDVAEDIAQNVFRGNGKRYIGSDNVHGTINFEMTDTGKVFLGGVTATVSSTLVLAAGWHTIAWSMGGIFLPMLPVVAGLTIFTAFFRKDAQKDKNLKIIDDQEKLWIESVYESINYKLKAEIENSVANLAEEVKGTLFSALVGNFDQVHLDRLIRELEDYLDDIITNQGEQERAFNFSLHTAWLDMAKEKIEQGDDLAAALFSAQAFEQLLYDINREKECNFNFLVPYHNQAFIEYIELNNITSIKNVNRLKDLKGNRNRIIHRLHHIAALPANDRLRQVKDYVKKLEMVRNEVLAND